MLPLLATHNRLRPWALWLALCVAWFTAMAPALSHALPFLQGDTSASMEICSAQGVSRVLTQEGHSESQAEGGSDSKTAPHCSFCLHCADRIAPASSVLPLRFMAAGKQHRLPVLQETVLPRKNGFGPPPRGPPACV